MKVRSIAIALTLSCVVTLALTYTLMRNRPQPATNAPFPLGKIEVIAPTTPPEYSYTSRGTVVGLPEEHYRPGGVIYLQLHHETIPDFTLESGVKAGMHEMIMDFPTISPSVSLAGLKIGDKVEFVMEVRWKTEPRFILTKLTRLDQSTKLQLSKVVEPGEADKSSADSTESNSNPK